MKKVIIIEDSPTFCNMLGKKLEAKGWKQSYATITEMV